MGCSGTFLAAPEQGQGLTPIVPHCSGSGPGPCPGTGHSQCDYTMRGTSKCHIKILDYLCCNYSKKLNFFSRPTSCRSKM